MATRGLVMEKLRGGKVATYSSGALLAASAWLSLGQRQGAEGWEGDIIPRLRASAGLCSIGVELDGIDTHLKTRVILGHCGAGRAGAGGQGEPF